jgi:hypothetical protein
MRVNSVIGLSKSEYGIVTVLKSLYSMIGAWFRRWLCNGGEKVAFKDKFRDFQELVREHNFLRNHNKSFKEGDSQSTLLLFAEGALILIIMERFLRMLPGVQATEGDTLHNLLQKATSQKRKVITLSADDTQDAIKRITKVRNTILHGNYEQAAQQARLSSKEEYFKTQFAPEIEKLYEIVDGLVAQIDPNTGEPHIKT